MQMFAHAQYSLESSQASPSFLAFAYCIAGGNEIWRLDPKWPLQRYWRILIWRFSTSLSLKVKEKGLAKVTFTNSNYYFITSQNIVDCD